MYVPRDFAGEELPTPFAFVEAARDSPRAGPRGRPAERPPDETLPPTGPGEHRVARPSAASHNRACRTGLHEAGG